ncbi:CHRD domain-containing protein [Pontibacter sp. HJ8]
MKLFKNYWLVVSLLLSLLFVVNSCDDSDDDDDDTPPAAEVAFNNIALTAANEVQTPPVTSTGTGTLNATYNMDTKKITYRVTWSLGNTNDNTEGMHFHGPASLTESASIVIGIPLATGGGGYNPGDDVGSSGSVSGETRALTQVEEDQLLDGLWYLNIHSTTYPNGELRGQLR